MNNQYFYLTQFRSVQTIESVQKFNQNNSHKNLLNLVFVQSIDSEQKKANKTTGDYLISHKKFELCFNLFSHKDTVDLDIVKACVREDHKFLCDAGSHITGNISLMRELVAENPACAGWATGPILTNAGARYERDPEARFSAVYVWLTATRERKLLKTKKCLTVSAPSNNQQQTFKI